MVKHYFVNWYIFKVGLVTIVIYIDSNWTPSIWSIRQSVSLHYKCYNSYVICRQSPLNFIYAILRQVKCMSLD